MERLIILNDREIEYLFRIIDTSISIVRRHQFFLWVRGEVQGLLPHDTLICVFDDGSGSVNIEKFSCGAIDEDRFAELCRPDGGLVFRAMSAWYENERQPCLACQRNQGSTAYRRFAEDMKRHELTNFSVHGTFDVNGEASSFFAFLKAPAPLGRRHAYLLELLVPHMHAALIRMAVNEKRLQRVERGGVRAEQIRPITEREVEILRYVQTGKSNHEIAHLLRISPFTVKNHVQKILRKLKVHNRAHAVAKAMALKIPL